MLIEKAGVFMATGGRECDGLHGEAGEQPFPPPEACTRTEHDRLGACSDPNLDYRYFTEQAHREGTVGGLHPNAEERTPDVRGLSLERAGDCTYTAPQPYTAYSEPGRRTEGCMRDVKGKHTRVHPLSAFLRAKDPIDKRERSEFPQ